MQEIIVQSATHQPRLIGEDLSPQTRKLYNQHINKYLKFCRENRMLPGVESLRLFFSEVKNPRTHRAYRAALKLYIDEWARRNCTPEQELQLKRLFDSLKSPTPDERITRDKYLTVDEIKELMNHCSDRIGAIIEFLFQTGCRISEALNARYEDVQLVDGYCQLKVLAKGGKEHHVFFTPELYQRIKDLFAGQEFLFERITGGHLSDNYITHKVTAIGKRIGKKISPHTLRHSKAMYLRAIGLDVHAVAQALGHKNPSTTLQYYFHGAPTPHEMKIENL